MKIGDLVKYRSWKAGDDDPKSLPKSRRGWDQYGVILEIGDWKIGSFFAPGESLIVYTFAGDFCEWRSKDAAVIGKTENNCSSWKCSGDQRISSYINSTQLGCVSKEKRQHL